MILSDNYIYKKEIDWSVLHDGFTLPIENQVVFGQIMGRFLERGESKPITLYLCGKSYHAKVTNVNFSKKFNRKAETLQIRYNENSELSQKLRQIYADSLAYFQYMRDQRAPGDRSVIRLPDDRKEYLAMYTTEYDDAYVLEPILVQDILAMKHAVQGWPERLLENMFNYDIPAADAGLFDYQRIAKISRLNRRIGDNLKLLYGYRCQICGKLIGEEYGSTSAEAHHIDFFTASFNSDPENLMVLCPNHHAAIHNALPKFDRKKKLFTYDNGYQEKLILNQHL